MSVDKDARTALAAFCCLMASAAAGAALPDPTQPYGYARAVEAARQPAPGAGVEWTLNGIRIRDDVRSAIVNGRLVKEGDRVDDATVVEIGKSTVILSHDHRRVIVRLLIPAVKRDVDDPKPVAKGDAE